MANNNDICELFTDAHIESLNQALEKLSILPRNIISIFHVPGHLAGDPAPAQFRVLYLKSNL